MSGGAPRRQRRPFWLIGLTAAIGLAVPSTGMAESFTASTASGGQTGISRPTEQVIGEILVGGLKMLDSLYVIKQSGLQTGRSYDPDEFPAAEKRLMDLGEFSRVEIRAYDTSSQREQSVIILAKEKPQSEFGIDGFVSGYWTHRNLFGKEETLRLNAKIANISFPLSSGQFSYAIGGVFTKPGVLTPDTTFVTELFGERTVLSHFSDYSARAGAGLRHDLNEFISLEAIAVGERSRFLDGFGTRDFATIGLETKAVFDSRDSTLNPTSGFYLAATAEPFYELFFGSPAFRLSAKARAYLPLDAENRFLLAGRLRASRLSGPSAAQAPPNKLYFAGGSESVRGYRAQSIGIAVPGGAVSGGHFMFDGSLEARARIGDRLGVVAFADAGSVATSSFAAMDEVQLGAGVGLRYFFQDSALFSGAIGPGPVRVDVAFPINPRAGDPRFAIAGGLGQAF